MFLRAATGRDAVYLAELLLDIILDMGVVPAVLQSDNEFASLAFEELTQLLGTSQLFSTALRPQSQGIVERSHRDIRNALAKLIEAYVRANPRKWPTLLRHVEHKLRHRVVADGATPYAAVHGFFGSTSLQTAMGALEAIPEDLVHQDWIRVIVAESKAISARLAEHWTDQAEARARKHGETKARPDFLEGELALVHKPFLNEGKERFCHNATGFIKWPSCRRPIRRS